MHQIKKPKRYMTFVVMVLILLSLPVTVFVSGQLHTNQTHAAGTQIAFTLFLHGIGKGGDSANSNSGGNTAPMTPTRTVSVGIFNAQNALVTSRAFPITYNAGPGDFTGSADFGDLPTGVYTITVRTDQYLQQLVPGIQKIIGSTTNQTNPVYLPTGDIDLNNQINILDYNILMGCYADLTPATNCDASRKKGADITDDGNVNQLDYNLFIRELSNRSGATNPIVTIAPTAIIPTATPPVVTTKPTQASNIVSVTDATSLQKALANALPGQTIQMADGTYSGNFIATKKATAAQPITLQGSRKAVIKGGTANNGYAVQLNGADYWKLEGFTITTGKKGLMVDNTNHATIDNLAISDIGEEGLHLRTNSSDNIVSNTTIMRTGLTTPGFGEGLYVGSAVSNWPTYTNGQPDKSDRNQLIGNTISATTAECIDIKEGTTGGIVKNNHFDGTMISGVNYADSWVDVKGNNYTFTGNIGVKSPLDGFQVHQAVAGWGNNTIFQSNNANVGGSGYGFNIDKKTSGTKVFCNNTVTNATAGVSNIACVTN